SAILCLLNGESKKYEEEIPSLLWGLDPVFSAFARLYIKDIKEMRESKQVPGVFFYNGHPVRQVDVVGMVVQTKEREAFHSYGVDDSTGVINCICWKNPMVAERSLSDCPSTSSSLKVLEQMKKFQEMVSQKTKLEIGDVIRVRGYVRTFRQQREIQSSYKVDDPVCDVQISRMLELPCLYREVYDEPFQSPGAGQREALESPLEMFKTCLDFLVQTLHEKVRDFLLENKIQTFYQQELETIHSLVSLADGPTSSPNSDLAIALDQQLNYLIPENALNFLDEKLHESKAIVNKSLLRAWLHSSLFFPADAEKGCHFLHVLSCVRQSYNPNLAEAVMQRVLELLESNSDIVSTMEGYYMAF
uniref:CST complex subunit STN1 n=1 Tax=Pavo cristatus TaxID=9049 RepID=A0A8C9FTA1_PAVCR